MNLIKTTALSALATLVRLATGLITNKIAAVYIGPAGVALFGQFVNFLTLAMGFAGGGINSGVTKYLAEHRENLPAQKNVLGTSVVVTLACAILTGGLVYAFAGSLSESLLKLREYGPAFELMAISLVFGAAAALIGSMLNGTRQVRKLVGLAIASNIAALALTALLVPRLGLGGALLAVLLGQVAGFFIAGALARSCEWFRAADLFGGGDARTLASLGKFALMALVSATVVPVSLMIIRDYLGRTVSWEAAGYWQGVWKISEVYLQVATASLSIYYLPRLSEIDDPAEMRKEIFQGYRVLLPVVAVSAIAIYVFREAIVLVLFSKAFLPMKEIFAFQLIGDFFKIASWLLGFIMIAKAMTFAFVWTEIVFSASFVLLSILFIGAFGIIGVTYAFCANYVLYTITLAWMFRRMLFG